MTKRRKPKDLKIDPLPTWDLYKVQSATERSKSYAEETVSRVARLLVNDRDCERRRAAGYCRWCWYRKATSLAGQAITAFNCQRCGLEHVHGSTATPSICKPCQAETGLCCSCCGDMEGKRRKAAP